MGRGRVLGRELDLSPLVILVSVIVWASLWGVVGALLAVPLTAAFQAVLAASESTRPIAILLSHGAPAEAPAVLHPSVGSSSRDHPSAEDSP